MAINYLETCSWEGSMPVLMASAPNKHDYMNSVLFLVSPYRVVIFVAQHQYTTSFPEIGVVTCSWEGSIPVLIASAPMSRSVVSNCSSKNARGGTCTPVT